MVFEVYKEINLLDSCVENYFLLQNYSGRKALVKDSLNNQEYFGGKLFIDSKETEKYFLINESLPEIERETLTFKFENLQRILIKD